MLRLKDGFKKPGGDENKGPHPDAQANYLHFLDMLKHPHVKKCLKNMKRPDSDDEAYVIGNYNLQTDPMTGKQERVVHDPVYVIFSWNYKEKRFGFSLSFHQPTSEYKKELYKFFRMEDVENKYSNQSRSYVD